MKNIENIYKSKLNNIDYRVKWAMGKWYNTKESFNDKKSKFILNISDCKKYSKKYNGYYTHLYYYFKKQDKILYRHGDTAHTIGYPVFTKSRPFSCNQNIIILLNQKRHWENVFKLNNDILFERKISKCFWRGTTTGNINRKGNRFDLVTKWFKKCNKIDVGFSFIYQNKDNYKKYVVGKSSINNMLRYKYIISAEGNDVASGLKWNLFSNSIVLMPKPTIVSWFMEDHLIPYVHYVPIKDDWSDLKEQYIWCEKNPDKCKKININAKNYVKRFIFEFRSGLYLNIIEKIRQKYNENIKLMV